jgi:hypothetical protein
MKRVAIIAIMFLIASGASSQEGFIGINLGSSIPKTDFGATNSLFGNGHALSGFSIEFDGTYLPVTFAGVGGALGFGSLITDSDGYLDNLVGYLDNHSELGTLNTPDADQFTTSASFWNYLNLLAGPELSAKIGQFRAGVRVMGGVSMVLSPKREYLYEDGLDKIGVTTGGNDLSLLYMYGGNLIYITGSGTAFKISAEYFHTRADYNFNMDVDSPIVTYSENLKKSLDIQYLIVSVGLSYSF